jgi:VWFA-related protein
LFDSIRDAHLTRDREPALKAISKFYGRRGDYTPKFPVEEVHLMHPSKIEGIRASITTGALSALATHLGGLNDRRKTLIFVSEDSPGFSREVAGAANRQNVAIYPVDPTGMPAPGPGVGLDEEYIQAHMTVPSQFGGPFPKPRAGSKNGLRYIAFETGAMAIVDRNDIGESLARIARESRSYYLIRYESPHPTDGKFHKVHLKVKRPRLNVRARSGYQAFKP